ncbi:unnamed protein product [Linum trigynum]|uniref:Wall-associated receptor kinase galacturonan-binding domain-containing protein n=1 Tax=Linum trigynum TaxID=586398 RepID=A0AAV2D3S5_9ROSI
MSSSLFLFLLLLQLLQRTCQVAAAAAVVPAPADSPVMVEHYCRPSSCGEIIIQSPFRLTTDPWSCGNHNYSLSCESNTTVLYLKSGRYYVKAINYNNFTIRLVDHGVVKGNFSSFPAHPLSVDSVNSSSFGAFYSSMRRGQLSLGIVPLEEQLNGVLALVSCDNPVANSTLYVETAPRIGGSNPHSPSSYAMVGSSDGAAVLLSDLADTCRVEMLSLCPITNEEKINSYHNIKVPFREIHRRLEYGFLIETRLEN